MKLCPTCHTQYPEDANFCPQESCATAEGPQRLHLVASQPPARFQPIERIGGGQTGDVWRAQDVQGGAEVAYKVVAAEVVSTPAVLARAEREFKQLMRVASPKIATIIECEKSAAGALCVVMELCEGVSLERILASGPLPFERAKSIVSQVGLALLEAQKVGLVHRDVAPKNILVSPAGEVKVINFPLAKPINERVAGVAAYLSPEQVQGKPVDQRSNTYSLAATLYHMLTGEPPFSGPSVQAVLDMQVSTPVLPPSQRRPGLKLPPDTDKLLLKALDKSSSRRHLTLRLFLNELEALKEQAAGTEKPGREAGLAKTMMFGGNQADIARMVAEARAAKAAAAGGAPATVTASPAAPAPMPAPVVNPAAAAPAHPIAPQPATPAPIQPMAPMAPAPAVARGTVGMGPTIVVGMMAPQVAQAQPVARPVAAAPAASPHYPQTPAPADASYGPTPPPMAPTPAPVQPMAAVAAPQQPPHPGPAAAPAQPARAPQPARPGPAAAPIKPHEAGKAPPPKSGAAFRETLWFKQGDVDQLVADAKAKMQAAGKGTGEAPVLPAEDARPLEDRYADDGSVTVEDRKKFSLRTGGTATALPSVAAEVPGEKMDESEMVGEISTGRRTLILVIAAVVILSLVVVIALMVKGKGKGNAAGPTGAAAGALAARTPPTPPALPPPTAPVGQARDADGPPGLPPVPAPAPSKPTTVGLGAAGGTTAASGATGGAKPAAAKKAVAKKKPAPKHPAKHKR
jgi:eukaryotic-like serine/threonine-protein kinase